MFILRQIYRDVKSPLNFSTRFTKNIDIFPKVFGGVKIPSAKCRQMVDGTSPHTELYWNVSIFFVIS